MYPSTSDIPEPEYTSEPAFKVRLSPSRQLPSFPLNLARIPRSILDLSLLQPPLNGVPETPVVGTEQWCTVAPEFVGEGRIVYPEPALNGKLGDGIGFPGIKPLAVGLWWPKVSMVASGAGILDSIDGPEDKKTRM